MSTCDRIGPFLDAYHDGELGRLRRWNVRRHVEGCPDCRDELAALAGIGAWVRDSLEDAPTPDLWSDIHWRLPRRPSAPAGSRVEPRRVPAGRSTFGIPTLGVGVVGAALALLVLVGPPAELFGSAARTVVRSLNTHGRPVMVLDGPGDATIIWLMDEEGAQSAEDTSSVWI